MGRRAQFQVTIPDFILEDDANCASTDPEIFYAEEIYVPGKVMPIGSKYAYESQAKSICHECPLINKCLEFALDNYEMGIWGGTTERDRQRLRSRLGIIGSAARRTRSYL